MSLPVDPKERKRVPLSQVFSYFESALIGLAQVIEAGKVQHQTIGWARDKSTDHPDALLRHLIDRDSVDVDGIPHVDKVLWRAAALSQEWHEKNGARLAPASVFSEPKVESKQLELPFTGYPYPPVKK